ncbi:MAG: isochorismate synthase [Bacteroidia bacterium]|nr:isochorismate synthase [Bacteroidia bacterium]NNF31065.1 isochorismate synthase [Flavobacteriaceae bacterium]NNJ81774.1 isochorismate synthase [Flavobacteriaceae bacterium]NNK55298.1 isochorismate synthase [Flavobacteriaceae bacterium]NNM09956.1 isochorismate synthase [Flavobacteriaceae bacterium]
MKQDPVLNSILSHYQKKLPFAVYALPGEGIISVLLQQNARLYKNDNWQESGFTMAPFNPDISANFIPVSKSKCLKSEFIGKPVLNKSFELIQSDSDREDHIARVKNAIGLINASELEKVVLSRKQEIKLNEFRITDLCASLFSEYPSAFRYLWYHPKTGLWCGATPELLLNVKENLFETMSLAGTRAIQLNGGQEWTQKEYMEQQIVTDAILEALHPFARSLQTSEAYTVTAGNLEHLRTDISGTLTTRKELSGLLNVLHPTPAVCGKPRSKALEFIRSTEGYDRSYYTGFVGSVGAESEQISLFVNLRCMALNGRTATIYTGGGITADSIPESEWIETCKKQETMLKLLSLFL